MGIFVSANASISGELVKSLDATFNLSGKKNSSIDKHPIEHRVSIKSKFLAFA